jgi:AraC family transcriptional regulator of adaptative response/methylated-DNA-[protein]-cysteine methyltransferase
MLDTLRDITIEAEAPEFLDGPTGDYERVRRIIAFISERWRDQPSLEAIAEHVGLSTTHVHHLFRRWCGLTPKAFLAAITLDNAKAVLAASASVLDTAYEVGLSGPGRLHDLFVTHEAMTPGDFKAGGAGLTMRFGFHPSSFGKHPGRDRARLGGSWLRR